jgi:hypothetical protein
VNRFLYFMNDLDTWIATRGRLESVCARSGNTAGESIWQARKQELENVKALIKFCFPAQYAEYEAQK